MLSRHPSRALLALCALGAAGMLAACSDSEASATVAVTGTDEACEMETASLEAGTIDFEFTNEAGDVNELYVLKADGEVVSEVENVTTGTTRTLTVDIGAGDYEVRCKPGQSGDGFATPFEVTGDGGPDEQAADRTVTFEAVDFDYRDLDLSGITVGDTIRFEMTNSGDQPHEFEVIGPDGEPVGEIAAIPGGESGGATVTFDEAGDYGYQCILIDEATGEAHTMLGMEGDFTVAS